MVRPLGGALAPGPPPFVYASAKSIDRLLHGQRAGASSSRAAARRTAANAGSATLLADVQSSPVTHNNIWIVRHRQSKEANILLSHREETRELPGERDNARNNTRCTKAREVTQGLDGQHQDVDRTPRGRVNQNDRGQR